MMMFEVKCFLNSTDMQVSNGLAFKAILVARNIVLSGVATFRGPDWSPGRSLTIPTTGVKIFDRVSFALTA